MRRGSRLVIVAVPATHGGQADGGRPGRDDGNDHTSPAPERDRPPLTSLHPTPAPCQWFSWLATALDRRCAPPLALSFLGAVLARGRRAVASWIRAAELGGPDRCCNIAVVAAGKRAAHRAWRRLAEVVRPLLAGDGRRAVRFPEWSGGCDGKAAVGPTATGA